VYLAVCSYMLLVNLGCLYIPHVSWKHEAQYLLTPAFYLSRDETNNVHNFMDYICYLTTPTCFDLQGQLQEHNSIYMNYCCNKSPQDALFVNFILVKNSTCFGQIYCPSSGVLKLYSQQLVFVVLVMLTVC
jgi:hypothetical protein